MAQQSTTELVSKLEGQVDDIMGMYDFAEKLYPYEQVHGDYSLNEDERRRNMVKFQSYGLASPDIFQNVALWGMGALYLFSRRNASHLLDFSQLGTCYASSAAAFMVGTSIGMTTRVGRANNEAGGRERLCLHRRVAQNE